MALGHRAYRTITREMVGGWVLTWKNTAQPKPTLRNYIRQQLEGIRTGLGDEDMDVSERDDYPDDTAPFIQIIMDEVKSFG